MTDFILDPILEKDSVFVKDLALCQIRLMNNSDFSWLLLVPRQNGLVEMTDLSRSDYSKACEEIRKVALAFKDFTKADKLNVAMIGNIVKQLHVHIVARFIQDKLFPMPVWGHKFSNYSEQELANEVANLKKILNF